MTLKYNRKREKYEFIFAQKQTSQNDCRETVSGSVLRASISSNVFKLIITILYDKTQSNF